MVSYSFVLLLIVAGALALPKLELKDPAWLQFKAKHNKKYGNAVEELKRLEIFQERLVEIKKHNQRFEQGLETWKKGVNQFTDQTDAELKAYLRRSKRTSLGSLAKATYSRPAIEVVPEEVDYRDTLVTSVKNQGICGSCWAFATVGSIEGQYAKVNNITPVSFSPQNLVDCSTDPTYPRDYGCDGGLEEPAFQYIIDNGLNTEADYPYQGVQGSCQFDSHADTVAHISSYTNITAADEDDLLSAVANVGPVTAAMFAKEMVSYESGIYSCSYCPKGWDYMDHVVLVVGYGVSNGEEYWLAKNTWGSSWGEDGFFRLARNAGNMCGIATDANFPTI